MNLFQKWLASESGATVTEYVLMASGVALVILAAVYAFGDELEVLYGNMASVLTP